MKALLVCGSPRTGGNTETLLGITAKRLEELGVDVDVVNVCKLNIRPCTSCRRCVETRRCVIDDDMTRVVVPKLLAADIVVVASPVYFNNVSACTKAFIDRTWCLRGLLRDKVGGGIVVGRGYGLESALTAIHASMLKHEMVLCHRGVSCTAFEAGEALSDTRALSDVNRLVERLYSVATAIRDRAVLRPP